LRHLEFVKLILLCFIAHRDGMDQILLAERATPINGAAIIFDC